MARPKLGEEKNRPERVAARITKKARTWLEREAKRRGASIGDVVQDSLERSMERK